MIGGDNKMTGGTVNFSDFNELTNKLNAIKRYVKENKKLLTYDNFIYWINRYDNLCIQDKDNYFNSTYDNKICLSWTNNQLEYYAQKTTQEIKILNVYVNNNKDPIDNIPEEYHHRINILSDFIEDQIQLKTKVSEVIKRIITGNYNKNKQTFMLEKSYENDDIKFTSDGNNLMSGTITINRNGIYIQANYSLGRSGNHFYAFDILTPVTHIILEKLSSIII